MKIGKRVKAKKYKALREKQALANAYIKDAKSRLKEDHRNIQTTKAKIKTFYHSRGLKVPARLSFKSLQAKDIKAYNELLDSIINDTFINPDKYKKYREKMEDNFREQFGDEFDEENIDIDDIIDLMSHPVVQELRELGMTPSEFNNEVVIPYYGDGLNDADIVIMLNDFKNDYGEDVILDEFFSYSDKWKDLYLSFKEDGQGFTWWHEYKEEFWTDLDEKF